MLRATGSELERDLAFGGALALLERRLVAAPDDERAVLLGGSARVAGPLLLGADPTDAAAPAQMALVHALHWVCLGLAAGRPLALVVDDLHWVDRPSLHLVAYLARRVAGERVLLLLAARPHEPGAPQDLLDAIAGADDVTLLRPALLTPAGTAAAIADLLGVPPGDAFVAACAQATGGNPLLLQELVRALGPVQGTDADATRVAEVGPEPVARSVATTLRHVPEPARRLARAVSVLEGGAPADLALALGGLDAADDAIDLLQRAGLTAEGDDVRLVHPLVRQALQQSLPAGERGRLHREAARLYADRGAVEAAGVHLRQAPCTAAAWVVTALLGAAAQALRHAAPAAAAQLLERALREPPQADQLPTVLAAAARAQAAAGQPEAATTFEAAIAATVDERERAELLLALAWVHQAHGRFADVVRVATRGLALGEQVEPPVRLELGAMHDAAVLWSPSDRPGAGRALRGVGAATGQAERVALADAAPRQLFAGDDHAGAVELALRAWDDGAMLRDSTADDPALVRVLTVLHNADALTEARAVADACLQDAHRRASPMAHATWRHLRGHVLQYAGQLEESQEDLSEALAARSFGWGAWLPVTAAALAAVLLERDDLDAAGAVLDDAEASGTHPAASPMWTIAQAARGRVLLAAGEADRALELLLAAGSRARQELGTTNPALGPWRADAVLALVRLARDADARELAAAHLDEARRWGAPRALAEALRVRAQAEPAPARPALLREAVELVAPGEAQLEHAHALLALGESEARAEPLEARENLRAALHVADRCGASSLARQAREGLVAAGARPRRRRVEGAEALTVSELRVARLAAQGHSTREIAEELFVTPKTVSFHLGNAYRKLGVQGRRDLAGRL